MMMIMIMIMTMTMIELMMKTISSGRSPCNLTAPIRLRAGFPSLRPGEHLDYHDIQENVLLILMITLNCVMLFVTKLCVTSIPIQV